jgi:hypothetical protein
MPAPGTGGVQTSLTAMVQGMMASARRSRRKPGPTPGAPIQSPGPVGDQRVDEPQEHLRVFRRRPAAQVRGGSA